MSNGTSLIKPSPMNAAIKDLTSLFERSKDRLAQVAPRHITPERMIRLLSASLSRTPKLVECDPGTLLVALMAATQLGLEPNTPLGHSYIVPMYNSKTGKTEAQMWPGYKGLILLAEQTGYVTGMRARLRHARDHWVYEDTHRGEEWSFKPAEGNRGEVIGGFAVAEKREGGKPHFEYMTVDQLLAIRDKSPSGRSGPWRDHPEEMMRKTLIKRCAKGLALSPEKDDDQPEAQLSPQGRFIRAIQQDDAATSAVDDMIANAAALPPPEPRVPEIATTAAPAPEAPKEQPVTRRDRASSKAKEARGDAPAPTPDPVPPPAPAPATAPANDAPPPPPAPESEAPELFVEPTGDRAPTVAEELLMDLAACQTVGDVKAWYTDKLRAVWSKLGGEEKTKVQAAYTAKGDSVKAGAAIRESQTKNG